MFFALKKYSFKPSYDGKNISKIKYLNKTYEEIFLKYIENNNNISFEEKKHLSNGIQEISLYIKSSIFFQIIENFNSKTPIEKKANFLFLKLKEQYPDNFNYFIEEEFLILSEDTVFETLGMLPSTHKYIKSVESSNIISFMKNILFYKILNFLENKVNSFQVLKLEEEFKISDKEDEEEFIDHLLINSNLKKSLNEDLYFRLKEGILTRNLDKDLIPYVKFLIEFKNKCIVL